MSRFHRLLPAAVLLAILLATRAAWAAPPAYLLLRRVESPGRHFHAGHPDAAMYDVRTSGYAYGYFGAAPRSHFARHYGYYDTYKQWSRY